MSDSKSGVVSTVSAKDWADPRSGKTVQLHSFQLQGERGWFRTGQKAVVSAGQFVKFFVDEKGNCRDLVIGSAADAAAAPAAARATSGGKDGYWEAKEAKDIEKDARYQSVDIPRMSFAGAQDRAVRIVAAMLASDCLPVAAAAKKADKYDIVLGLVNEVTNRFFLENMHAHERLAFLEDGGSEGTSDDVKTAEGEEE